MAKVKINTCSRWELLRLPGVGNTIADKICKMREEGVQFTRDNLVNIPYLANSPELFEMIDYTTMVSDFTDLDPLDMYQRLKKVEEPRVGNSDELFSQNVSSPYRHGVSSQPASVPEMTRVYKPLVSAPMKSNNFLDTDQISQLYMGSLDSNDSYRPFPIMNQKRVVAGELSQGQVGDIRLQQGTYIVSSAPVQSGISTVCPDVDHVTSNTGTQQQYSTSHVQHTPPGMLWGTHIITQGNNTYSVPPPHISVQQEPNMLGEMYNVLQQMKTESDRLVESTRKHTSGLADVSLDYTRN